MFFQPEAPNPEKKPRQLPATPTGTARPGAGGGGGGGLGVPGGFSSKATSCFSRCLQASSTAPCRGIASKLDFHVSFPEVDDLENTAKCNLIRELTSSLSLPFGRLHLANTCHMLPCEFDHIDSEAQKDHGKGHGHSQGPKQEAVKT